MTTANKKTAVSTLEGAQPQTSAPANTDSAFTAVIPSPVVPAAKLTGLRATLNAMAQERSTVIPVGSVLPSSSGGVKQGTVAAQRTAAVCPFT